MNLLDRAIASFAPRWGVERAAARALLDLHKRSFAGAGQNFRGGQRGDNWLAPATSANAEIAQGLVSLRNRSRDMIRNNGWAARGQEIWTSNLIGGHGLQPVLNKEDLQHYQDWAANCGVAGCSDFLSVQVL
ncbi:MAG: phage portal protein, partial [Pseudomonadota bacterium]